MEPIQDREDKLDDVDLLLYVKDKVNISNKAWHEMAMISKGLPTSYSLKKRVQAINSQWNIIPTPGDKDEVQIQLQESLEK